MMIALNDSSLANTAYRDWFKNTERRRDHRRQGARMYFGRMQLGHALEALLIVKEIGDNPSLKSAVDACDATTKRSFAQLLEFIEGPDFRILLRIRNNLAFHYDRTLVVRALKRIVSKEPSASTSFTLGTEPIDWHFLLGDEVVDSMMVRDVLGVNSLEPAQPATDEILNRIWSIQLVFADFAGYFVRHYS